MPAAIPVLVAVTAGAALYQGIQGNQDRQHAKGAAEANEFLTNAAIADQKKSDAAFKDQKKNAGVANQQAAIASMKAAMSAPSGGGTILTGGQGAGVAPTVSKTLLGV